MNARLKVLHEKANVKSVKLLPTTVIGRSTECDLKISSSEVSRVHCRIIVRDDAVFIEDLGSSNGTFVNDQLLSPREPVAVDPGARISIGPAEFLVDYIAPTSNTVVVRRTDQSGKPIPAPLKTDAESENRELIFSSIPDSTEFSGSESTIVPDPKENFFAAANAKQASSREAATDQEPTRNVSHVVAQMTTEPRRPNPTVQPIAKAPAPVSESVAAVPKPVVATPKPAIAAPRPAVAVSKPTVAVPIAAPMATATVPTRVVPTANADRPQARTIAPIHRVESVQTPPEASLQSGGPGSDTAVQPENQTKPRDVPPAKITAAVAAPAPQFTAPEPVAEAGERIQPPPVFAEMAQFNFVENSESHRTTKPASKPGNPGGLKSLLSVFGRKTTASKSNNAPAPDAGVKQFEPTTDPAPVAAEPAFSFGAVEPEVEAPADSSQQPPDTDDDFQNFLRQF